MTVNAKADETLRALTERALQGDQAGMANVITDAGPEIYEQVAGLAVRAASYVVLYAAGRWPVDADLKRIATAAADAVPAIEVTAADTHKYLARSVFGGSLVADVFKSNEDAPVIPVYVLASLLIAFAPPHGRGWNQWLDIIENAIDAAEKVPDEVLFAAAYRLSL